MDTSLDIFHFDADYLAVASSVTGVVVRSVVLAVQSQRCRGDNPGMGEEMSSHFQIAIIGSGPAGLSAGARAAERKLSHMLFEKSELGNTIYEYQLRKHVMDEPARLPLRSPLPFKASSREQVLEGWAATVRDIGVRVKREEVLSVVKRGELFELKTSAGEYTADKVVLAIGVQGTPRRIGVPGDDLPHVGYTLADPDAFKNEDVIVIGAGDAAIENALALAQQNRVSLVNRSGEFPRAKDANVALIQNAIKAGRLRCYFSTTVKAIDAQQITLATPEGDVAIRASRIIARLGAVPPRGFLDACGISLPKNDPQAMPVVSESYESNVPGLYVVGSLIGYPLIKQAINQGYEVIEHILGNPVEPADEVLVAERFAGMSGTTTQIMARIKGAAPLFAPLSAPQFRELIIESTVRNIAPGERVIEQNDYGDSLFCVLSGSVLIEIGESRSIDVAAGNFFGEMGLLSGRRRAATVSGGVAGAELLEMPRKQILKLMNSVKAMGAIIDRVFVLRLLESSLLRDVPPESVTAIAERAVPVRFQKGEVIFKEGDPGDILYVIRKGSVKISRKNARGVDVAQTYVAAGNWVGEMALLADPPLRNATVTAAVPCEMLKIERADFSEIMAKYPLAEERILQVSEERRLQNLGGMQDTFSGKILDFLLKEGVSDADNVLVIDSDLCVGCDNCEKACAATHGGYSRLDRKGGKSFASVQVPISCRHCENPLCMLDCPPDALVRRTDGEVVIRESCIGCGNCVSNCPYGVIQLIHEHKSPLQRLLGLLGWKSEEGPAKAAKCDLCEGLRGGPACVRSCPTGAAVRMNPKVLAELVGESRKD